MPFSSANSLPTAYQTRPLACHIWGARPQEAAWSAALRSPLRSAGLQQAGALRMQDQGTLGIKNVSEVGGTRLHFGA